MMHFQFIPYLWVLLAAAAVVAAVGFYAWRQRRVPGARPVAVISATAAVWSLANALEMAGTDLPTKLFWANVQYLCYGALPLASLALALHYAGQEQWLTRRRLAWLAVVPAITLVLVWTDPLHGLMRRDVVLDTAGPFPVIGKTYGPWFWVFAAYSYGLLSAAVYLLIQALRRASPLYRGQPLILLIALCLPLVWNILYSFGLSPVPRHDIAPAVVCLSGIVAAWGLFRFRLLDIVPIARDAVIEDMDSGVIVLDQQQRVVDLNPEAQRILDYPAARAIGRQAEEVFEVRPALAGLYRDPAARVETVLEVGGTPHTYASHISPLIDRDGQQIGQVIILHDITEYRKARAQLLQQQLALAVSEERERIARELHDSLGQVLAYVNTQAQAASQLLSEGQTATAENYLARLVAVAQEAHSDVREYIASTKGAAAPRSGFFTTLAQSLQRFDQNYKIHTELTVPPDLAEDALEPSVEVQLVRIIQEALANVRKHAGASSVQVSLSVEGSQSDGRVLQITVQDDGCGFDPALPSAGGEQSFGLSIMRERAEEIGSCLEIHSAPGQGTHVIVRVPLPKGGRDGEA
jgi:PAS domain S-box-containing protein